jgi:hypothetical protein
MCVQFEKLVSNMSLSDGSENCSQWLPVYTAEIIKCLFISLGNRHNFLNVHKDSSKGQKLLYVVVRRMRNTGIEHVQKKSGVHCVIIG